MKNIKLQGKQQNFQVCYNQKLLLTQKTPMKVIPQRCQQSRNKSISSEKLKKILPEGTCDTKTFQQLQAVKTALNHPLAQQIVFSQAFINLSWIIVKQPVPNNQPIYHLYCESLRRRFLSSQKQTNNIGCNYIMSKSEKPQKNEQIVGKLRGNFRDSEFIVYDGGDNPKKKTGRWRRQFASIKFNQQSIFSQSQQANLQIIVPQPKKVNSQSQNCPKYLPKEFTPQEKKQNLLHDKNITNPLSVIQIVQLLANKTNKTYQSDNLHTNSFGQKLQNRINTKLQQKQSQQNKEVFVFNSRGKNTYSLKFTYPFNIIQAFGIALTLIEKSSK